VQKGGANYTASARECYVSMAIPANVKRLLRQEAGFGCAACGGPVFQYHHIVPRNVDDHNRPEDMVVVCPNHHDECTRGAVTDEEQRTWKANPYNVARGYANGLLKVNQSYCAITCGSCLLVNDGAHVMIDGEQLLGLSLEDGRVQLSMTLYDDQNHVLALIEDNEWLSGDPAVWDLEASYQRLTLRIARGDIRLRLLVDRDPMTLEAQLWRNRYFVRISREGITLNGAEVHAQGLPGSGFQDLGFARAVIEIDTKTGTYHLTPDPRFDRFVMVSAETGLQLLVQTVNALSELRAPPRR
jgi:predicted  nucleic acid-binding Zn-ribbon protein